MFNHLIIRIKDRSQLLIKKTDLTFDNCSEFHLDLLKFI